MNENNNESTVENYDLEPKKELKIFVTEEDRTGTDVTKMSDFFSLQTESLINEAKSNNQLITINDFPRADIGIIKDSILAGKEITKGKYTLIPDFSKLPDDIKEKLEDGSLILGDSKQVKNQFRATIVDPSNHNQRVKDITLKKVLDKKDFNKYFDRINDQIQMRQIYQKLDVIEQMNEYQIRRDRDRDIVTPFLNARNLILIAQNGENVKENLKEAKFELNKAINAIYTDISTNSKILVENSEKWFLPPTMLDKQVKYIAEDLHYSAKYVGVYASVLGYLGETESAKDAIEYYQSQLKQLFNNKYGKKDKTIIELMHLYGPRLPSNPDYWLDFREDLTPFVNSDLRNLEEKEILLISPEV